MNLIQITIPLDASSIIADAIESTIDNFYDELHELHPDDDYDAILTAYAAIDSLLDALAQIDPPIAAERRASFPSQ